MLPKIAVPVIAVVHVMAGVLAIKPPYRDGTLPIEDRVEDLLWRMTLEEKAGQMYHARHMADKPESHQALLNLLDKRHMTHFLHMAGVSDIDDFITKYNAMQHHALQNTNLGIPITLSTDPQHGWTQDGITSNVGKAFSRWPEPIGLAALGDLGTAWQYGDIVRQELGSVGLRHVLYPQVDLITEYRWGRAEGTLGEDATLTTDLMLQILDGLQGGTQLTNSSIISTAKHFPGGGPQENGTDPHTVEGQFQVYPGENEIYHLRPFKAAIQAGVPQIMPYYARPKGNGWDSVGFSFSKTVIQELLQKTLNFKGVVATDFGVLNMFPWGVENKTVPERLQLLIEAGCDIIGGEQSPEVLVQLVEDGVVSESRINVSVRKLLEQKFRLGLFDNPYINKDDARKVVGHPNFIRAGEQAQRRSFTLISTQPKMLPLKRSRSQKRAWKIYSEGIKPSVLKAFGLDVVEKTAQADFAFLRLKANADVPKPGDIAASLPQGSLEYNATERARQAAIFQQLPTIVDIEATRPPAVPEVVEKAAAVFISYGSSPEAFLDVVFGITAPEGRLPFDLPRSDEAVAASLEDVPFDTQDPVFRFGHGLRYD